VTGANKGIGFYICKKLLTCATPMNVLLGARDENRGVEAVKQLKESTKITGTLEFVKLDIEEADTIVAAVEFVKTKFGHLDILVNNAGLAYKGDAFNEQIAAHTIKVNYIGTKLMCQHFMPIMKDGGRVVNVSSTAGTLGRYSEDIRRQFTDENMTFETLDALTNSFIDAVRQNNYLEKGWTKSTYSASKAAMSALTRILQRQETKKDFMVYACCPGYCQTDMSSQRGNKSAEEGADTPVWLALQDSNPVPMGFYSDRKMISW